MILRLVDTGQLSPDLLQVMAYLIFAADYSKLNNNQGEAFKVPVSAKKVGPWTAYLLLVPRVCSRTETRKKISALLNVRAEESVVSQPCRVVLGEEGHRERMPKVTKSMLLWLRAIPVGGMRRSRKGPGRGRGGRRGWGVRMSPSA